MYENTHLQLLDSVLFMRDGDLYHAKLVRMSAAWQFYFLLTLSWKGFIHDPSFGGVGVECLFFLPVL